MITRLLALSLQLHAARTPDGRLLQAPPAAPQTPVQVQAGVAISPETVTVGQHFTVTVRVRVPVGTRLDFPAAPQSTATVDTVSAPRRVDNTSAIALDATETYVLAAWDTGTVALGLDSIVVHGPSGDRLLPLGASVRVRSVLPADTTLRVPKPPRALIPVRVFDWLPWAVALAALLLAALLWWLWRRWRRERSGPVGAGEWAEREFARIESAGWLASGDVDRYAIAMTDVLRGYLWRVAPGIRRSATTRELAAQLREATPAVRSSADHSVGLMERVDLVKFAAERLGRGGAADVGAEARRIVADVERARVEAEAAEAARVAAEGPTSRVRGRAA